MVEDSEKDIILQWGGETSDWSLYLMQILRSDSTAVSVSCVGSSWALLYWWDFKVPPISSFYSSHRLSLDNPSILMNSSPHCKIYTSSLDSSLEPQMPLHIGLSHPVGTQRPCGQFDWHFIHPFPRPVYFIILYSLSEVLAPLAKQIWNREITFASSFIPNKSHSLNH